MTASREPTYTLPSAAIAGELTTSPPVSNRHFSEPSGRRAYTLPSHDPTTIVPSGAMAGDESIQSAAGYDHFSVPSEFSATRSLPAPTYSVPSVASAGEVAINALALN